MSGWERLQRLGRELWWIFKPQDELSRQTLIAFVIFFLAVFLTRKEFGGFFKAFFKLLWVLIVLMIANSISPWLMWGIIAMTIVIFLLGKHARIIKIGMIGIAIVGAIVFAFYNVFIGP